MATGTRLMKEISEQFLICKICSEQFKEPKTLSCLHTFCCACVQQQYDAEANRPTRYTLYQRSVTCPLCQKKTDLPTGGVRRLPDNFLVSSLTEVLAKRSVSKVPPCEICHTVRAGSNEACSKCLDCDKLLCRACVILHSATKVTQDHSLIDLEGQKDIECKGHPEETVRFYCEKCDACICVVCTFQEHKDHDVCSFNDGFAKHKVILEKLVGQSKERLTSLASRLNIIDKYEHLSKELKERIRDLAISYTSQIRAREKELIKKVDDLFGGELRQLAESKAWLQENFDSLQSACNLTEIVMKDKGVEMLLLKKEIQDKMDHLLEGPLPAEPENLQHLDVTFIPGKLQLGDVIVPGEVQVEEDSKGDRKNCDNGVLLHGSSLLKDNHVTEPSTPCKQCAQLKETGNIHLRKVQDEERKVTKSVYIQTRHQEMSLSGSHKSDSNFTAVTSQACQISPGVSISQGSNVINSNTAITGDSSTDSRCRNRKGRLQSTLSTVTDRQTVRTLTTQTEDSCLRDYHLGAAAASGSSYPNTGAAIAAAFLRHKDSEARSCQHSAGKQQDDKLTRDVEVATDISLGLSGNAVDAIKTLCQKTDSSKPDLLAQTSPSGKSSPWIRSRKVQTDISALCNNSDKAEDKFEPSDKVNQSFFGSAGNSSSPPVASPVPVLKRPLPTDVPSTRDASVMTSFKIKVVQDSDERDLSVARTVATTRTVYIQTLEPRLTCSATSTDYEGQQSKSTSTMHVASVDAETAMPQVTHENRTTWTDTVMTSERATCTTCPVTSDAATLTAQVRTNDFASQVRPQGMAASTNTVAVGITHHQCQTSTSLCTRGTMPDPELDTPVQFAVHPSSNAAPATSPMTPAQQKMSPPAAVPLFSKSDKATDTSLISYTTRAVGSNSQLQSWTSTSTDTLHLFQVRQRATNTLTVKTVDDWTLTTKPQMMNTGVTPPRPAVLAVGVATIPITVMDQATYTEVKTLRESGTETCLIVCDSETVTERTVLCDAQTEVEIDTESSETAMEVVELTEGGCMTEELEEKHPQPKAIKDSESQCGVPELLSKEVNTTRFRRRTKEVQTTYSYVECLLCQHLKKLEQSTAAKTFTDTSTDPSPPDTHDVGTMALSCLASAPGFLSTEVQTSAISLYDKEVATSFELDEEVAGRSFLALESQDAATSTESLPYIGLLSEIDVDELIVIPEANFELVSDSDSDYDLVPMVDDETWTGMLDYAEVGTQTLLPTLGGNASGEDSLSMVRPEEDCSKSLVSIGVNTTPKVTFEKETTTPMRHLFSKGTMTFYVAKMDKATSTLSRARSVIDSRCGATAGRVIKERLVDHKDTMTCRTEQRDIAVETESALLDGRFTQCISKLRNVSQRLNSPTARKNMEVEVFFGQSFLANRQISPASPRLPGSPKLPGEDITTSSVSPPTDKAVDEERRKRQLHSLLAETDAVLRSKDLSPVRKDLTPVRKDLTPVRKAQPITTLRSRAATSGDAENYASKSLPRQRSLDRQNKVKMGSQSAPSSRLPLLRYNSAPGRIATVPAQTLLLKVGQTSPRTSPSKIPISQKQTPTTNSTGSSDSPPDSDILSITACQKLQQRPFLPSISETRTPSSCSDSSVVSAESADSSLNPASVMTSWHSRTSSNLSGVSDTPSEIMQTKGSVETASTELEEGDDDHSSVSSTSTTLVATPAQGPVASPGSTVKQKKEKKGFMHRLLSGKRKKDGSGGEKDTGARQEGDSPKKQQPQSQAPQSLEKQSKQQASPAVKAKQSEKPKVTISPSPTVAAQAAATSPAVKPKQPQKPKVTSPPAQAAATSPPAQAAATSPPAHAAATSPPAQAAATSPPAQAAATSPPAQAAATSPPAQAAATSPPAQAAATSPPAQAAATSPPAQAAATSPKTPPSPVSSPASSRPSSADSSHSLSKSGAASFNAAAASPMPPHHYPPLPDPNKTPAAPHKPRPFVYVRQRILSIQQDNVEEVQEKKEKEKEDKEKDWNSAGSE